MSRAVIFARLVRPALLSASVNPDRKVAFWLRTEADEARRSAAVERRRIVGEGFVRKS